MNVQDGNVNVVEQLRVVLDAVAAAEEDHDFLFQVLLQEREEQEKAAVCRADDVALLNVVGRRHVIGVVDADVQRLALGGGRGGHDTGGGGQPGRASGVEDERRGRQNSKRQDADAP